MEEEKFQIEYNIGRTLKDITRISKFRNKAERDMQKAVKNKLARDCEERLKCDIYRLKKELKRTEKLMDPCDRLILRLQTIYTKLCQKVNQHRKARLG